MALAQAPRVLLLDEPLAGLSRDERIAVKALIAGIPREVTIVMIEHDMDTALDFAERITVLHYGEVIVEGTRAEVVADPRTREIYLGDLCARQLDGVHASTATATCCTTSRSRCSQGRLLGLLGRNGAGKTTCMSTTSDFSCRAAGRSPVWRGRSPPWRRK